MGYGVTVFDRLPVAGGMMAVGIPEYRLPRAILNKEISHLQQAGVEIRLGQELGRDFSLDGLLGDMGYQAVVMALGAHRSLRLGIPGEELPGVYPGTVFLKDVALGKPPAVRGKRVAVVGGGAVAVDAARTALRLGAESVHILYRRTREDMPAWKEEVHEAFREGVGFHFLTHPIGILGPEQVSGIECQLQRLGEFDLSGRRRPVPIEESEYEESQFVLDADMLIVAIGQTSDLEGLQGEEALSFDRKGGLTVGDNLTTTRPGVFAAGDLALGPATVIEAVAQGNRVAVSVDAFLRGETVARPRFVTPYHEVEQQVNLEDYADAKPPAIRRLSKEERTRNFLEVEAGLDERAAREEAKRCLRCELEWLAARRSATDTPGTVKATVA
jgi:NADH-quinone oxidoreductase subunit F